MVSFVLAPLSAKLVALMIVFPTCAIVAPEAFSLKVTVSAVMFPSV